MASNVVALQAIFSVFNANPIFYNLASYIFCGAILMVWAIRYSSLSRFNGKGMDRSSGNCAAHDVDYLPPGIRCETVATLCSCMRDAVGWTWPNGLACPCPDFCGNSLECRYPIGNIRRSAQKLSIALTTFSGKLLTVLIARPSQVVLLAMCVFYLWVYMRRDSRCRD